MRRKSALAGSAWPTPVAYDDNKSPEAHLRMKANMPGGPRNTITSLKVLVQVWPTPTVFGNSNRRDAGPNSGEGLRTAAVNWATPTSRDWKDGANPSMAAPTNGLLGRQAPRWPTPCSGEQRDRPRRKLNAKQGRDLAAEACSHPDPEPTGPEWIGETGPRSLNPRFVEWLQGCPPGFSSPDPIAFESLATWWSLCRQRLRSVCSDADSPKGVEA